MWTRINRKDFGLSGLVRAITLPALGKRDLKDNVGRQYEEQDTKKGKVVNEEGSFVDTSSPGEGGGGIATLGRSNEADKLELLRAWEPLER